MDKAQILLGRVLQGQIVETEKVDAGGIIYSSARMNNQLVILTKGKARIIDKDKTFLSQTVSQVYDPHIFGLSQLLQRPYQENVRAVSNSEIITVDIKDLDVDARLYLYEYASRFLDEAEWPYLYRLLKQKFPQNISTIKQSKDFAKNCHVIRSKSEFDDFFSHKDSKLIPIIYVGQAISGFTYGQIITWEICKIYFTEESWPRLLVYNKSLDKTNNKTIVPDKVLFEIEEQENKEDLDKVYNKEKVLPYKEKIKDDICQDGFTLQRSTNKRDSYYACLKMINDYFNLPPKNDTLQRAADFLNSRNESWMDDTSRILDKFGLAVREITVDIRRPLNIPIPSIWFDFEGNCQLISAKSNQSISIIDPISGRQNISQDQAYEKFSGNPNILHIDEGLHTPTKRFDIFWLLPFVKKYRSQLIEVFGASFLNQIFALATPLLFQQIIDRVISKGASDALTPLAILMLSCALLEVTFSTLRTFQFVEISNRIDIGVGSSIVSRLLRLNARFFDSRPVGELSSRMNELTTIRNFLTGTALTVILDAIFSLLYFAVMMYYSLLLTVIVFLTIPPLLLVTVGITPITQKLIRRRAEAASRTQSLLVEILGGIQTIKLQNAEVSSRRKWEDRHLQTINHGFRAVLANTGSSNALQLINKISNIIVIGVGASLVVRNELTLGELIAFRIIAGYVTQPMIRLASSWQNFQEMSLSLERIGDIVNQKLEVEKNEESNIPMPDVKGKISLENISYQYSSTADPILSGLSLEISQGSFTGFVGQSGCGKSTLLKLIPRLYRPNSGKICIDDYDIGKIDLYSLRDQIGFVPQDCMLFEGTILSNISLDNPNVSSKNVVEMSKLACAHEFIMGLPYGYSTPIGEKGSGLSGGQRQRIALARMLLQDPKLVILDEATSALDVDTEKQVVENLRNHFTNKTLLMITHRLSSLTGADQIVVMHSGRIDAIGNHDELIKQRGRYYALYQSQFGEQ